MRDVLGLAEDPDSARYIWMPAKGTDPDVIPRERRLMLAIAERSRWRDQLRQAQERAIDDPSDNKDAA